MHEDLLWALNVSSSAYWLCYRVWVIWPLCHHFLNCNKAVVWIKWINVRKTFTCTSQDAAKDSYYYRESSVAIFITGIITVGPLMNLASSRRTFPSPLAWTHPHWWAFHRPPGCRVRQTIRTGFLKGVGAPGRVEAILLTAGLLIRSGKGKCFPSISPSQVVDTDSGWSLRDKTKGKIF